MDSTLLDSIKNKGVMPPINRIGKIAGWFVIVNAATYVSLTIIFSLVFRTFFFFPIRAYSLILPICCLAPFYYLAVSRKNAIENLGVTLINPQNYQHDTERDLYEIVETMRVRAGLSVPVEVGYYSSEDMNAFATGRDSKHALIAFTTGLINQMDSTAIAAVAAHEVAHIANGDMVTLTILRAATDTAVKLICLPLLCIKVVGCIILGMLTRGAVNGLESLYHALVEVPAKELALFISNLVEKAFSRHREYQADAMAGEMTDKTYVIHALEILGTDKVIPPPEQAAYASLRINSPLTKLFGLVDVDVLATHPRLDKRIQALQKTRQLNDLAR